jgi:hypothetical protein
VWLKKEGHKKALWGTVLSLSTREVFCAPHGFKRWAAIKMVVVGGFEPPTSAL